MVADSVPAMCGSDTFTTVVSSTSMKVANITETAISQGLICLCSLMTERQKSRRREGRKRGQKGQPARKREGRRGRPHKGRTARTQEILPSHLRTFLPSRLSFLPFRLLPCCLAEFLFQVDRRRDRHAGTQAVFRVLPGLEHDLHRHALHDLHEVAGRVLRRKQAEARAGCTGDTVHLALELAAVRVNGDRCALAL